MKVERITVKAGMKYSKNFNTVDRGIILEAVLDENDNLDECHNQLSEQAHEMLKEDIRVSVKLIGTN